MLKVKRVYESPAASDGVRVLIDRIWPRGLTKRKAAIDAWFKDLAPSTKLRQWFNHDPDKWPEFRKRYARELSREKGRLKELRALARRRTVTLVYGARDEAHNNAVAMRALLRGAARGATTRRSTRSDHRAGRH